MRQSFRSRRLLSPSPVRSMGEGLGWGPGTLHERRRLRARPGPPPYPPPCYARGMARPRSVLGDELVGVEVGRLGARADRAGLLVDLDRAVPFGRRLPEQRLALGARG